MIRVKGSIVTIACGERHVLEVEETREFERYMRANLGREVLITVMLPEEMERIGLALEHYERTVELGVKTDTREKSWVPRLEKKEKL